MREIKFRAWHKFSEEIIPVFSIDFENQIINSKGPWRFFSEIELMQYTGLKDKNGIEIYEGDMLAWIGSDGKVRLKNYITYSHSSFNHKWLDKRTAKIRATTEELIFGNVDTSFEIIGNIYEHPHLLEESQ